MRTKAIWTILTAFALTCTTAAFARAQERTEQRRDRSRTEQMEHNRAKYPTNRWENRKGWEYRAYNRNEHPEGWREGRPTSSRYCGGHQGCYMYNYSGAPYYYYRDNDGRMIVRRKHERNRQQRNERERHR